MVGFALAFRQAGNRLRESFASLLLTESLFWWMLAFVSLAGVAWTLLLTGQGVGLGSDSAVYISAARNLLAGNGLAWIGGGGEVHPVTHFPPLFPLLLAGFEATGSGALQGARILNSLAFGVNIFLAGAAVKGITKSNWFSLFGAGLALGSIFLVRLHTWAMTEPLYLSLGLAGLITLVRYLGSQRLRLLVASAVLIGLGYLTRYVGVALVATGALALALNFQVSLSRRARDLFLFLTITLVPNLVWMARNAAFTGAPTSRTLALNLLAPQDVRAIVQAVLEWFIPASLLGRFLEGREGILLVLAAAAIGAGLLFWLWEDLRAWLRRERSRFSPGLASVLSANVMAHLGVLLGSILFFFPRPEFHHRSLFPLHFTILLIIPSMLASAWRSSHRFVRFVSALAGLLFLASYVTRSGGVAGELLQDGQGYSSASWRSSETIQAAANLPAVPLYSNQTAALYLLASRPAYFIPLSIPEAQDSYGRDLQTFRETMMRQGAMLVLFDETNYLPEIIAEDELTRDLTLIERYRDGAIYAYPSP